MTLGFIRQNRGIILEDGAVAVATSTGQCIIGKGPPGKEAMVVIVLPRVHHGFMAEHKEEERGWDEGDGALHLDGLHLSAGNSRRGCRGFPSR